MLQICYASRATHQFSKVELTNLLEKSRTNNERAGISGLLLHHNQSFLQLLEGDEKTVIQTYNRIRRDPRHSELQILFKETIQERSFESWAMGFVDGEDAAALPGYLGIFDQGFSAASFRNDNSRAKMVFIQFRDGLWHREVKVA